MCNTVSQTTDVFQLELFYFSLLYIIAIYFLNTNTVEIITFCICYFRSTSHMNYKQTSKRNYFSRLYYIQVSQIIFRASVVIISVWKNTEDRQISYTLFVSWYLPGFQRSSLCFSSIRLLVELVKHRLRNNWKSFITEWSTNFGILYYLGSYENNIELTEY